jgi:hexosaminidase
MEVHFRRALENCKTFAAFACKRSGPTLGWARYEWVIVLLAFFAILASATPVPGAGAGNASLYMMPIPASVKPQPGAFLINSSLTVQFAASHDAVLQEATWRALTRLEAETGVELSRKLDGDSGTLLIDVTHPAEAVQSLDEDESYTLLVNSAGIRLQAPTDLGALHGLQTLLQLVQVSPSGPSIPAVTIRDQPRFQWRGLMIDCGRHFEPLPVILRTLDGMEAVKLNVFHWHLTEDQGFRVESLRFPKLQELGSDGQYYTQAQIREVVAYAHARGIRVVPEFDMPGHTTSWFVGYPDLASSPGPYTVQRRFGVHDPAMDPTLESTYKFLDRFIGEMADLFPDAYMHIGGDESNGKQWLANPRIRAFMQDHGIQNTAGLQVYFNQRLLKILTKYHKHMVGWDEILTPGLPKDIVVQSWRGVASLAQGAKGGYQGILSAPYYLDGMHSAETHYLADPIPANTDLTKEQQALILGGEVCMWGEQIAAWTIDSRIWPRTAAIAERFWSPSTVRDVADMYRRLGEVTLRLDALGLQHISGPLRLQRELAGTEDPQQLNLLLNAVEPVSFGERYALQHTDQLTPLYGLVDAATPDPLLRHEFAETVQRVLAQDSASTEDRERLIQWLEEWRASDPGLGLWLQEIPQLAPYSIEAHELAILGVIGTESLSYLQGPLQAPPGWAQRTLAQLQMIEQHKSLVRFVVIDSIRQMVLAAAEKGGQKQ